jgi:nucleotide-binding universal stress UspA family protein
MPLKNLMVHLDQSPRSAARLTLALALARKYQARLVGVFGQLASSQRIGTVASWPTAEYAEAAAASKAAFAQATAGLPQAEWRDINRGSEAEVMRSIIEQARYADLVVLGQHDASGKSYVPAALAEEVVLHSGRPVLIVPYAGEFAEIGKRPLLSWSNGREAARALNDALPLIEGCQSATVLSLSPSADEASQACAEVIRHLACHGIKAESETLQVNEIGVMDMLLNKAADLGSDLLVMGAQGQASLPFASRGTGTSYILGHMTVPVLMSH